MFKVQYIEVTPPKEIKMLVMEHIYKQENKSLTKRFTSIKKFSVYYIMISTLIVSTLGTTYIFNQTDSNNIWTQISQLNSTLDSLNSVLETENALL